MKKVGMIVASLLLVAGMVVAGDSGVDKTEPLLEKVVGKVVDRLDTIMASSSTTDATILSGELPAGATYSSIVDGSPPSASTAVTNGQAVTLSGYVNFLKSSGGADDGTNTVTLANGTKGATFIVFNDTAATNALAVAKTGNFKSPAIELSAGEGAVVVYVDTNAVYAIEK